MTQSKKHIPKVWFTPGKKELSNYIVATDKTDRNGVNRQHTYTHTRTHTHKHTHTYTILPNLPFLWEKSKPPPPFILNFENPTPLYKGGYNYDLAFSS